MLRTQWDRQPYLTHNGVDDGWKPSDKLGSSGSMIKSWDLIMRNFWINGYNGVWTIDHDDGSQFMNDTHNFMVWGGCKVCALAMRRLVRASAG
eukprot:COSAG06_NODE_23994_length_675_cov_2.145833_2_plen_93_part_00